MLGSDIAAPFWVRGDGNDTSSIPKKGVSMEPPTLQQPWHTQNKGAEQEIPCSALAVAGLTNRYASRAGGRGAGAGVTPAGWATGTGAAAAGALGAGAAATGALGAAAGAAVWPSPLAPPSASG